MRYFMKKIENSAYAPVTREYHFINKMRYFMKKIENSVYAPVTREYHFSYVK